MYSGGWTPEQDAELKDLYKLGLSASVIANKMKTRQGTRNAVIGRLHRIGMATSVIRQRPKSRRTWTQAQRKEASLRQSVVSKHQRRVESRAPRLPTEPIPPPQDGDIARVSFLDLELGQCKFIPGDPKSVPGDQPMYCGLPVRQGASYCPHHHQRCEAQLAPSTRVNMRYDAGVRAPTHAFTLARGDNNRFANTEEFLKPETV